MSQAQEEEEGMRQTEEGMTLIEEAASEFGTLQVFKASADYRDKSFAGATLLMRAHTPDAVLSEYRAGGRADHVSLFSARLQPLFP